MAPIDSRLLVIQVLKFIICVLSSALQLHFVLLTQVMMHQHSLNQEFLDAIEEKNRALYRYRQLRSRFMRRKKKRYWKNPGRTEKWWQNMLDGSMLPEEWIVNFRMCRNDFMKLEEKLGPYIRPSKDSFRGDTICSVKKRVMKISFRPETKKVSAHMKISGRPENSDRPEKAKWNSGRPEFHFACIMWALQGL